MVDPLAPSQAQGASVGVDEQHEVARFLTRLGSAMAVAGASVTETRVALDIAASAYGLRSQITVMPGTILIRLAGDEAVTIEISSVMNRSLRLDQIDATFQLVDQAKVAGIAASDGLERLGAIWRSTPRHSQALSLFGYMLMSVGFGLMLQPSIGTLIGCALLGLLVGELLLLTGNRPALTTLTPVVASLLVGLIVFFAVDAGFTEGPLLLLIPPLVILLPGAMLTTGMIELQSGDIVSGSSRLVAGGVQLVLLLFGLTMAAFIIGVPSAEAFSAGTSETFLHWGPLAGVFIFGAGIYLYRSAPPQSLPWLLLVLLVAWAGQQAGDQLVGGYASGLFGAIAMTPVAYAIERWRSAPAAMVSILPAYWMLVPGALGLIGLTKIVAEGEQVSVTDYGSTIFALIAISLGVSLGELVRVPLVSWFNRVVDRLAASTLPAERSTDR
ncbi:MAG: hypothetical protein DCC58_06130 [Chloroflexi bacterium]|nr:MAG: hypothetical protein DCC58_06130 [Chloroflexota bacterium]